MQMAFTANPLLGHWLNFGQFELFNPHPFSKRNPLNCLIRSIILFNVVKCFIILLAAWFGFLDLKLYLIYLIEIYLLDMNQQRFADIGVVMVQLGVYLGYSYWVGLHGKVNTLNSFRFLLIPDDKKARSRYERRYQLDQQSTDKFFALYRLASAGIRLLIMAYFIFLVAMILRCLYHSLDTVGLAYFLTIGLLLSASTSVAYLLAVIFAVSKFVLVLLSTEFLIYRLKGINSRICQRFIKPVDGPKKIRQQRASLLRILHHLNDFCQQFQAINTVLDTSISMLLVGVFIFVFIVPWFLVFVKNDPSVRLVFSLLAIVTYMFCFSFSICNDRLRRQVGAFVK